MCKEGVVTVPKCTESIQMAVVTHMMGVEQKQNENKTICHVPFTLCSLSLPAFLLAVAPGPSISMDNSMLFNDVYLMNNNNPSLH